MNSLTFNHTGLLVDSIDEALSHYSTIFGTENISQIYHISSQKVKVCFIKTGRDVYLELVEPAGTDTFLAPFIKRKASYYHVAYKVKNIHQSIEVLEKLNYKALSYFNSEAFNNNLCIFLFTPEGHLIELIEDNA